MRISDWSSDVCSSDLGLSGLGRIRGRDGQPPPDGRLCNVDENDMPSPNAQGLAFRTFDIARGEWAIYWVSGEAGVLQAPVFGRFEDGVGRFYGVEVDDGRPVQVIYVWKDIAPTPAHWAQAFSYDGGRRWE